MNVDLQFERIYKRMEQHFTNESKILEQYNKIRSRLSEEQTKKLLIMMANHPHTIKYLPTLISSSTTDTALKIKLYQTKKE